MFTPATLDSQPRQPDASVLVPPASGFGSGYSTAAGCSSTNQTSGQMNAGTVYNLARGQSQAGQFLFPVTVARVLHCNFM